MGDRGPDQRVSDTDILKEIALSPDPIVTASELTEKLPYSRQRVNQILDGLVENGWIDEREVGARAVVYWLTEEGQNEIARS
ncbi:MarR family winged helix-turn-helix transcriptional regulator [Haloarcula amylovorans]|uniref:MarR family winged helix-turn-helix transcriptional regulator n=1 Tax=Haloarcula amylovorans TaxID=2562280 RepID=UPI00107601E6|nr:MarR family winged helix-turn-helix transcriptional regulator [Halomicroarcula amylolytica]